MTALRESTGIDVDATVDLAADAVDEIAASTLDDRARWLRAVADSLDAHASELVEIADRETHIGAARLTGEVARTSNQLRLFADVVLDGAFLEVVIDHARPDATPPAPDLRRMLVPIGPVAVYSASNFPLAFSVAGGDTASALAAGCPVVVKGHPGHPELSARTAELVTEALDAAGAPRGAFGLVMGLDAGRDLVTHPHIAAAAFTGSTGGGRALFDLASSRPDPIPFYGELGSVNPVIVSHGADRARSAELAAGLAQSFQFGLGQLCTKPGLVFVPRGGSFADALVDAVPAPAAGLPLGPGIGEAFRRGAGEVAAVRGVRPLIRAEAADPEVGALVVVTDVETLEGSPVLLEEHFGPLTILVEYDDVDDAVSAVERLHGSLTATLHAEPDEVASSVVSRLGRIAGRVLFAGWPTGVAVTWAQHHGGPWPATTSIHTSVGATSIRRFLRPLAYQSAPEALLPEALRESNPLGLPRRVDGRVA